MRGSTETSRMSSILWMLKVLSVYGSSEEVMVAVRRGAVGLCSSVSEGLSISSSCSSSSSSSSSSSEESNRRVEIALFFFCCLRVVLFDCFGTGVPSAGVLSSMSEVSESSGSGSDVISMVSGVGVVVDIVDVVDVVDVVAALFLFEVVLELEDRHSNDIARSVLSDCSGLLWFSGRNQVLSLCDRRTHSKSSWSVAFMVSSSWVRTSTCESRLHVCFATIRWYQHAFLGSGVEGDGVIGV